MEITHISWLEIDSLDYYKIVPVDGSVSLTLFFQFFVLFVFDRLLMPFPGYSVVYIFHQTRTVVFFCFQRLEDIVRRDNYLKNSFLNKLG